MREFFRGWRRKTGCVALAVACVLAAGWVRSLENLDFVNVIREGPVLLTLHSTVGKCGIKLLKTLDGSSDSFSTAFATYDKASTPSGFFDPFEDAVPLWRINIAGVEFGQSVSDVHQTTVVAVSYWFVTIPPTLLSAYLILWKPRKRATTPPATPPISN